jgi:single-strand DNA-binding protein
MLNTVTICGRIANDLELRHTPNGTEVLSFAVACERDFKDQSGNKPVDFIDVVTFKNTAVFVSQYFAKGRMAIINGRLQTRTWQDKDGNKRKAFEIVADNVYFADSKTDNGTNKSENRAVFANNTNADFVSVVDDDELPFF